MKTKVQQSHVKNERMHWLKQAVVLLICRALCILGLWIIGKIILLVPPIGQL
jgi:hypothetical protein